MSSSAERLSGPIVSGLLGTTPASPAGPASWWHRLTFRLVALVVMAATLPALVLGILLIRSGQASLEREVVQRNISVARWGVEKVDSFIETELNQMRLLIKTNDLGRLEPSEARAPLSVFLSFIEEVKEVALLDAQGREQIRLSEGTLYTSGELASGSDLPEFKSARSGTEYVGPVTASAHGEPRVTLALPIQNLFEGRVTGVLVAKVNLKRLWEEVLSFQIGKTGYVYLVDQEGRLIAHPDFSLVLAGKNVRGFAAVDRFLHGSPGLRASEAGAYRNYQGREVLGVVARSARLGWGVIVEQPVAEAFANVHQAKIETTVMFLNTLLLAILLGTAAARQVARPIRELVRGAATVGAGNLTHTLPVRGESELAEVAVAFNWMTANLRRSFQGLRTLLDSTTRLAKAAAREEVFRLAAEETQRAVWDTRCAVLVLETTWDGSKSADAAVWQESGRADATVMLRPGEDSPVSRALSTRSVIADRAERLPTQLGSDPEAPALVVPFPAGHHAQGALLIVRSNGRLEFGEADMIVCRALTNHLSFALQLLEAHEQLVRTEKLRTVGEIAAGVAHNFNNVLAAILGRAQLLQRLTDPAEVRQGLSIIERAALNGASIVRRLQDSARLRSATPFTSVALDKVIEGVLELTRPRWKDEAELRNAPIVVETAVRQLPAILGDPGELSEVVTNIILNAVEAMPTGGQLRIGGVVSDGWITLSFSDTGGGMPEHVRQRIFDPFFTTKDTVGTGLGMTVSYAIVERHGGKILVDSAVGVGTTVRLRLPVAKGPVSAPTAALRPGGASASRRILVADDDRHVCSALTELLTSLGHRVEAVNSGQQALERFAPESFDLVMTDLGMELSGREVARRIKARSPRTPVILVTGWAYTLDRAEVQQDGVDFVLAKPFQIRDVEDAIDRFSEQTTAGTD